MIFGLGLEKAGTNPATMQRALELGVKFYDTAPTYCYGLCENNFGIELKKSGIKREDIIISAKTHDRDPDGALVLLERSLKQLQTDYIDIWSLQDLSTPHDLRIFPSLEKAKKSGKVKYIGITSIRDPMILKLVLENYQFDYAMMTINIADKHYSSFIDNVLPYTGSTKVIAMQVFLRGKSRYPIHGYLNSVVKDEITYNRMLQDCINYVSSFPVDVMLIGCNGVKQLEQDLELFNTRKPMTGEERAAIEKKTYPFSDMLNFSKSYKK